MYREFSKPTIGVTNRHLYKGDILERIKELADTNLTAILLREKDMTRKDYKILAAKVLSSCKQAKMPCILHTYDQVAVELGCRNIHLPIDRLEQAMANGIRQQFMRIGTSIHSLEQLAYTKQFDLDYVIYGHIFQTDCKKELPPRGLHQLEQICKNSDVPVFAIGGINDSNEAQVMNCGAKGICRMSELMR